MTDREAKEQLNELKKTFNTLLIFESVTIGDKKEFLTKNIEALDVALDMLENERPKGKWESYIAYDRFDGYSEDCEPMYRDIVVYICPFCGKEINEHMEKYCPNCGTEMREVE